MMRGTFANIRIKNQMVRDGTGNVVEGGWTLLQPTGERMFIYDAAQKYAEAGTPLVVFAGKEYGTGSSRDWAAKGTKLLGVRAVIAESFERIHRSNLVGMGVLPLEFTNGESRQSHALTGFETYEITGLGDDIRPRQRLTVKATAPDGSVKPFEVMARIDTPEELSYYKNGGILPYVLRSLVRKA
jgi:aconitate hydratase